MFDSCAICVCVYNSERYLPKTLKVIDTTAKLFKTCHIFFAFDSAEDKSGEILEEYVKGEPLAQIIPGSGRVHKARVANIAEARNNCLTAVRQLPIVPPIFIMMDANYSIQTEYRPNILVKHLENADMWDALTFNRKSYYDLWALSFGYHKISLWHLKDTVVESYRHAMVEALEEAFKKVRKGSYLEVDSAFCGFGVYKTSKYLDCEYTVDWRPDLFMTPAQAKSFMKPALLKQSAEFIGDCEHRNFHAQAARQNNARIMIANDQLFKPDV